MAQITEIPNTPWRDALRPAAFRTAQFHIEVAARENGRRIVQHEFPKRDIPYAEDMGRKAFEFTVRGYCIAYPFNTERPLYQRDYRVSRDLLIDQLEQQGAGLLQLPLLPPMVVVVQRYRITEEQKAGGYCAFDITFQEAGKQLPPAQNARDSVLMESLNLVKRTIATMDSKGKRIVTKVLE